MAVPVQRIPGRLFSDGNQGIIVLDSEAELLLRFALVEFKDGVHFFPEFVLDDWGAEINGLHLYHWIRSNGIHFPRAEVFGYHRDDQPQQRFVRELDLAVKYPCYAFLSSESELAKGTVIRAVITPDIGNKDLGQLSQPAKLPGLLPQAAIQSRAADTNEQNTLNQILESFEIDINNIT